MPVPFNASVEAKYTDNFLSLSDSHSGRRKGAVKHVVISTAMRTGNKKVTLIRGLETFGVSPDEFAHHMQRKAAASTSG